MKTLINISSPEYQLRANRNLWLLVGGVGSVAGLFVWSATPFAFSHTKDKVQVCLRYLSLLGTLSSGVAVVAAGSQLTRISPLIRAVEMAEKDDFLTQLAASQYNQQQHWDTIAKRESEAQIGRQQTQLQQPTQLQHLPPPEPASTTPVPPASEYKQLYLAVTTLRQAGVSDSSIIKDVLQQNGQDGKAMLAALLQLGQQEEW